MAELTITPGRIKPFLRRCGYKGDRLREDYVYSVGGSPRKVDLVGFAEEHHDSRTACIAVIEGKNIAHDDLEQAVDEQKGFGAPVVLVCWNKKLLLWHFEQNKPKQTDEFSGPQVKQFFENNREDLSPSRIYEAKMRGHFEKRYQLGFVDMGLMDFAQRQEGKYLSELMVRIIKRLHEGRGSPKLSEHEKTGKWLVQAAFWLLGAKILKDKRVPGFKTLSLTDIPSVVSRIQHHYGAANHLDCSKTVQIQALEAAAEIVKPVSSLANMTIESLAHVYEDTLISKATREALGTHATPSWLVDYIVWQLADWIEAMPEKERIVLEPACGHAPFLTAAARLLSFIYKGPNEQRHEYLRTHLIGLETDSFAGEIARLSLTLSDIPNKDGWAIRSEDIYKGDSLKQAAATSRILLCNPPFQSFTKEEKSQYGGQLEYDNKAAEVLARTLPHMPINSVFGVVLPRVFLQSKKLKCLREYIIKNFEIREICLLPENVFTSADHRSCLILGRKTQENAAITRRNKVRYAWVPKADLDHFKNSYGAEMETITQNANKRGPDYDFRLRLLLSEVWDYCRDYPKLGETAVVGRGIEYKRVLRSTSLKRSSSNTVQGFVRLKKPTQDVKGKRKKRDLKLTELPDLYWMDLSADAIRNQRYGKECGRAQVLMNYGRASKHGPWRMKAMIDRTGRPVTNSFLVIRPQETELEAIWALLNSPFANAYAFCHSMERHNLETTIENIPLPECSFSDLFTLKRLVRDYFALYEEDGSILQSTPNPKEAERRMLAIDAEVMRLYDLPPRLEKELLDLFNGYERKGIDFSFNGYYPKDFESYVPLHVYLSEAYKRSTVGFAKEWVQKNRSDEVIAALDVATESFGAE